MNKSIFDDQADFMRACGQTVGVHNYKQAGLYLDLIAEECEELASASDNGNGPEVLDALTDLMVVVVGFLHSVGVDAQRVWDVVHATNMAKIYPLTGKVDKRADGKILKPEGWKGPQEELTRIWEAREIDY